MLRTGLLSVLALLCTLPSPAFSEPLRPSGVVYLTRHASTVNDGTRDPELCPIGWYTARALANVLEPVGIKNIFTSSLIRTQQTARPLSVRTDVPIQVVAVDGDIHQHASEVARKAANAGPEPVLVVGHSNTVPAIIRALGGPIIDDLREDQFGDLFVLRPDGELQQLRYGDD